MKIRRFRVEDAKKVSYLIRKAQEFLRKYYSDDVVDLYNRKNSPAQIIKKSKDRELFVAVEKDRIIGVNGLKKNQVRTYYVNPRYHKKGIGRKLYENVEKLAKKRGIKKLILYATPFAEGFYKKMGFKKVKRIITTVEGIKFPEIYMEKKI